MTWTEHVTKTAPAKRRHQSPAAARRSVTIGGGVSKMSAAAAHSSILKQSQNGKRLSCWVHLSRTASGMDKLPAWFLRVGAPLFYKPVTCLLNKSIVTSTVPCQWNHACILPTPKTAIPQQNADYRPISITPVLSRLLERVIVRNYLYPAIIVPPASLYFTDQYAFRPTGSTTAALIALLLSIYSREPWDVPHAHYFVSENMTIKRVHFIQ